MKRAHEHPECFEPEKDNPYPLCVGKEKEKDSMRYKNGNRKRKILVLYDGTSKKNL